MSTVGASGGFFVGGAAGAVVGDVGQIENKINGKDLDLSAVKISTDVVIGRLSGGFSRGSLGTIHCERCWKCDWKGSRQGKGSTSSIIQDKM